MHPAAERRSKLSFMLSDSCTHEITLNSQHKRVQPFSDRCNPRKLDAGVEYPDDQSERAHSELAMASQCLSNACGSVDRDARGMFSATASSREIPRRSSIALVDVVRASLESIDIIVCACER